MQVSEDGGDEEEATGKSEEKIKANDKTMCRSIIENGMRVQRGRKFVVEKECIFEYLLTDVIYPIHSLASQGRPDMYATTATKCYISLSIDQELQLYNEQGLVN